MACWDIHGFYCVPSSVKPWNSKVDHQKPVSGTRTYLNNLLLIKNHILSQKWNGYACKKIIFEKKNVNADWNAYIRS